MTTPRQLFGNLLHEARGSGEKLVVVDVSDFPHPFC
jgi:hypothetical protein